VRTCASRAQTCVRLCAANPAAPTPLRLLRISSLADEGVHAAERNLSPLPAEYRADVVVVLLDGGSPFRVILVEVQLSIDPGKRLSWPTYVTVSRPIHGCPTDPLRRRARAQCRRVVRVNRSRSASSACLCCPSAVPIVREPEETIRRPELGVLSVMAHGETERGTAIAAAVLPAILELDDDRGRLYYDLVYNFLNEAARREMEMMKGYEYQSDFAKKYVAQGRAEGLTQGRAQEAAHNLLSVLRIRGIAVPDAARERILAQTDPERLERWLEKAVVAASVNEVLDEPS